jgi:predicted ATPase/DNA-binding SARP family transcriptional activator
VGETGLPAADRTSALDLGLLGPVRAVRGGRELPLGGPKQRAVLALLALEAGRVVSAERLIEQLWRGVPPPGAATTLRSYVSRLRHVLAPDTGLAARGGGYLLTLGPAQLDAAEFEQLVAAARAALAAGEAVVAANRFRAALNLWRGPALAAVTEVEALALEAARLEELRLAAVEGRIEADLALGGHTEVTGELEALVNEYPVRERLWSLLVLALYRANRQAEALAACRRARSMLAEELGLDPGPALHRLEQQVLRQEVPAASPPVRRGNLPVPLTSLMGREPNLAAVQDLLARSRLVTLTGPGGSGKTRLAVEAAARAAGQFRDGAWLAGLAGISRMDLVAPQLMEALGARQAGDMPVIDTLVFRLRSAELLLVLDNCEHLLDTCARLTETLLAAAPGLRVLATSREPLGISGEVAYLVPPLDLPPESTDAQAISQAPAVQLFMARAVAARAGAAAYAPAETVARICRRLDGLPLAIELAAARATTLSAAEIEAHLADKIGFLRHRRPTAEPRHQTLQAAIGWSYQLLTADERRMFAELSTFAGGFTLAAGAAVCCDGDQAVALELIDQLAAKSLLTVQTTPAGTRYQMLETIRDFAGSQPAGEGENGQLQARHAEVYLDLAEQERRIAVLAAEQDNFRAALAWSLGSASSIGPRLARALGGFWLARGFLQEAQDWLERALQAGPADPGLHAHLLRLLGTVLYQAGDLQRAEAVLSQGSGTAAAAGLAAVQARIRVLLAEIHNLQAGADADALTECEAAAAVLESEGDSEGLAEAWLAIGRLRFFLGDPPAAGETLERAAVYAAQHGNQYVRREVASWLVVTYGELSIPVDAAIGRAEQLLEVASGDPWAEAAVLSPLSMLYAYVGRFADARTALARAQSVLSGPLDTALSAFPAGRVELVAANPAGAERVLTQGRQALRAMGDRGYLSSLTAMLAEALYEQGRLSEVQQLTEEDEAAASPGDVDAQARWLSVRAKLLARRGQFTAARQLAREAVALAAATSYSVLLSDVLLASAEVSRLAGELGEARASLRRALRIYEDGRALALAERARGRLADLSLPSGTGPA